MRILVVAALLFVGTTDYPQPEPKDHWQDVINHNGEVIWLNQDRIWREQQRIFAVIRIAPENTNFRNASDAIVATDCQQSLRAFSIYEDFRTAPLNPIQSVGLSLMRAICEAQT